MRNIHSGPRVIWVTARITAGERDALREAARREGVTVAQLVRNALRKVYLHANSK